MILMVHDEKDHGMVALAEGMIAGEPTPARQYRHDGAFLVVETHPHAQAHDVAELERLGYRLATAKEQEEFATSKRKKGALSERGNK